MFRIVDSEICEIISCPKSHPLTDIINLMVGTKHKKSYEVSSKGWITVYPSLHENKEKGKLRRILKRLIQLRKGHYSVAIKMTPSSFRLVRNLSFFPEGFPTRFTCGNDNLNA